VVTVVGGPSQWPCLILGEKGINFESGRVITPLFMALQSIETTTSVRL